jgi:2-polyprenyl-3-methyl-5-hydroxy-6-metoxy-1,4-benzoquinol methylase
MVDAIKKYGWDDSQSPNSYNYITPKLLNLLKAYKVKRVCDIGSGNGALANELDKAGFSIVGVEYAEDGVSISSNSYAHIRFYNLGVQDDPTTLVQNEGKFDAVISTEVVEHLFSPHQLPIFSNALLDEDGLLFVTTPHHGYIKNLMLSIFDKWDKHHTALWHGGHIKFWSRRTLTKLLEKNGFEVMAFYGVGRCYFLWKSMILVARKV